MAQLLLVAAGYVVLAVASLLALVHLLSPKAPVISLGSWPSVPWLYMQFVNSLIIKRRVKKDAPSYIKSVPRMQVSLSTPVPFSAPRFNRFLRLCNYDNTAGCIPLMFPIAESFRLYMQALVLPDFPFTVIGSVLARNTTEVMRPIKVEERLLYRVYMEPGSWHMTPKGDVEVDVVSEALAATPGAQSSSSHGGAAGGGGGGSVVWRSTTTSILLNPKRPSGKPAGKTEAAVAAPSPAREVIDTWKLKGDVGRQYGMISEVNLTYPAKLVTEFKRPTLLPASLKCAIQKQNERQSVTFAVTTDDGAKEVLTGTLSWGQ